VCVDWNALSSIATVAAVVVALAANRKSTQQLKSALEIQEQSKNVSLLDRRIELIENIQSGKDVSELTVQVLFNNNILKHYKEWKNYLVEKTNAEGDLNQFFLLAKEDDGAGGFINDVRKNIEEYEMLMSRPDCPHQVYEEYEKYCNTHTFCQFSVSDNEVIEYNYCSISKRLKDAKVNAEREKEETLQLMKEFAEKSILPIGEVKKER
jgi:hypothetical protein